MSVAALKPYVGTPRDTQDKFHGGQLLYVGWDQHLMFCAPFAYCLPPATRFGDFVEQQFAASIAAHPDAAQIDWSKVQWLKSSQPWTPDFDKSLADNGLKHKDVLRIKTPGLNGIQGCAS